MEVKCSNFIKEVMQNEKIRMAMKLALNRDKNEIIKRSADFLETMFEGYGTALAQKIYAAIKPEDVEMAKQIITKTKTGTI